MFYGTINSYNKKNSGSYFMIMKDIIILMRPQQWVKNLFVFAPLFFNGSFTKVHLLVNAIIVFGVYCMVASSIYCFNDIYDRNYDKRHIRKRLRPIAAGKISVKQAYCMSLLLAAFSFLVICCWFNDERCLNLCTCIFAYLSLNVAYCVWLKRKTLIDVFIISIGFILRILSGGLATDITISHWLVLMTFLLALFLALAKRRDDVVTYEETGQSMRNGIDQYNLAFMNQSITLVASVNIICYILYTVSPEVIDRVNNEYLYLTSIFVLLGMLRYMQLTIVDIKSGSPTKVLLHDHFIQVCIIAWCFLFISILYL